MRPPSPSTEAVNASDVRQQFASVLNSVFRHERRVLVEKSGIPVAAVVSTDDLRRLERLDEEDREAMRIVDAMRKPFAGISSDEIEREAANAVADDRAKRKKTRTKSR